MKTLTAGSFLNLENDASVEALKFTARRLAEHSGNVVTENLNAAALENLANNLWEKAAYVTRETERRRLHQIFNENFSERFRELKPEVSEAEKASFENATTSPEIVENGESEDGAIKSASSTAIESPEIPTAVEGKKDEFLGFVESGEPFADAPTTETEAITTPAPEKAEQTTIQTGNETVAETIQPENQSGVIEKPNSENQIADDESEPLPPNQTDKQSAPETAVAAAKDNSPGNAQVKNKIQVSATDAGAAKEPFELGKCTVNLNLVLLPVSASGEKRKVIVSAMSHNLPPEIDFLEITEGDDVNEIARLVSDKLARFEQTLPAKYIEQLRQSKTKASKNPATVRTPIAVPTQTAAGQAKDDKTSGERKSEPGNSAETDKSHMAEQTGSATRAAFVPQISKPAAANTIQGSLF